MEACEKPTKTLSGDKSLDQEGNEGYKAAGVAAEKSLENGFRVSINGKDGSCIDQDCEGLEDSELNGASSLLQMKESIRKIDVNGGRNESGEGFGTLLGAVDKSKEIGVENVLPNDDDVNDDDETEKFDGEENGDKMIVNEIDDGDDNDDDGGGGEFAPGYFVWGKIKSHPWWPGQVYNPTDASDYAVKLRQKGRLLVAYFGDSSFAWCHPSQLKPFEENFEDMSKVSSSKNFVNAVRTSVDEIGRLVESKMTCSCVPGPERPLAENAGIKQGVHVPEGGTGKVSIGLFEPQEVLGKLKQISQAGLTSNLLECAVLKGWLSAFNRSIGRPEMPEYHEPLSISDTEENVSTLVVDMSDYSEAVGTPITKPVEEDWIPSSSGPKPGLGSRTLLRCPDISEDGMYHRRKQKSIAEILKSELDVQAHKVNKSGKRASSSRSKKKGNDETDVDDGSNSSSIPRKLKETELLGSQVETDVIGAKEEMDKGRSSRGRKPKKIKQASDSNNGDDQAKEDTDNQLVSAKRKADVVPEISRVDSFSRERKKSKYLSPPYTSSTGKQRKMDTEESVEVSNVVTGNNIVIGERNEVPAKQEASIESSSLTPKPYLNQIIDPAKVETPADEVLAEVQSVALSPQYRRENSTFELVAEFLSAFRSSVYQDRSYNEMYNQFRHQKKRKYSDVSPVSSGKDQSMAGHIPSGHKSHKKKVGKNEEIKTDGSQPEKATLATMMHNTKKAKPYKRKMKKNNMEVDGNSAALFVTFGPGSSLPNKDDLIRIYSRYGALDIEDTDMFYNTFCARVVFIRTSDAEQAFIDSQNDSPFGSSNVSFRLRIHQDALAHNHNEIPSTKKSSPLANEGTERPTPSSAPGNPQLNHIRQKLEMLKSILETADEKMLSETKSKVQSEIKGLLEMVNTMVESSS